MRSILINSSLHLMKHHVFARGRVFLGVLASAAAFSLLVPLGQAVAASPMDTVTRGDFLRAGR